MKWFVSACLILSLTACTVFMETRQPPYTAHGFSSRSSGEVQVLWIGHSTVLLRLYDKWVLTDPNFSTRVGLVVKRFYYPGADLDSLPSMDAVLISHTHMDHLDRPSLSRLKIKGRVAVPAGAEVADGAVAAADSVGEFPDAEVAELHVVREGVGADELHVEPHFPSDHAVSPHCRRGVVCLARG